MGVKKWHQYLLGHRFIVLINHQSLKELMAQVIQTLEQQLYLSHLLGYNYMIQYHSGKYNMVVDALSRAYEPSTRFLLFLSIPHFTFLDELKKELAANSEFLVLQKTIKSKPTSYPDYSIT